MKKADINGFHEAYQWKQLLKRDEGKTEILADVNTNNESREVFEDVW